MGYCGVVFRIDFKRLAALRGSKDKQILKTLGAEVAAADDDFDEEDEVKPSDALRHIIMGEPIDEDYVDSYGAALVAVYHDFGELLDNSSIAPAVWRHFEAVDAALAERGVAVPIRLEILFSRGLPVLDLDSPEPFPVFGFFTPDEIAAAPSLDGDWSAYGREVENTVKALDDWLKTARRERHGLVAYYA